MTFLDQLTLHRFFGKEDPTDEELLAATVIIDNYIKERERLVDSIRNLLKPLDDPSDSA